MFYATWSRGFRPGGINRPPSCRPTTPTSSPIMSWAGRRRSGHSGGTARSIISCGRGSSSAFLGENSLTVIQNGRDAKINGIETDVNYVTGGLTLNAAAAYTDAKTKGNICSLVDWQRRLLGRPRSGLRRDAVGDAPAGHSQVQDVGNRPLRLAGGHRASACAGERCPPGLGERGHSPGHGWLGHQPERLPRPDQGRPWSICSPATTGGITMPNCSQRTSSTSATSCRESWYAASVPGPRSFPAGRGRSAFAPA